MYNILNLDHYNSILKINVFYSHYFSTTIPIPINLYVFFLNDKMIMMKMMVKSINTLIQARVLVDDRTHIKASYLCIMKNENN